MSLVNMRELINKADKEGYAVGAFSVANLEMVMGAIRAAEELNSPIILQIAEVRLNYSPLHLIGPLMIGAAKKAKVPVAVHFDHGLTEEKISEALEIGFTSVMIDGSKNSLEENISITKKIVKKAEAYGAAVEAEIGIVGGSEDGSEDIKMKYTDVLEAKRFFEETKVDALAVAIGNAHGLYKFEPKLNLQRLKEIDSVIEVPLVLHGGTGITAVDFKNSIKYGIRKINVATATFNSVESKVYDLYKYKENRDYFKLHTTEVLGAYENVKKHIEIFGSKMKA
ncbi:class II fructose-bisphosphate aldolase [Clostridium paraputrificum]|uniref:class II fructose-bisphosphate aldolase n=1 Tax=Clostridium paraputrificum TaxID=29363 RepID=UPI003D35174D